MNLVRDFEKEICEHLQTRLCEALRAKVQGSALP